jgi:hypothetical protein
MGLLLQSLEPHRVISSQKRFDWQFVLSLRMSLWQEAQTKPQIASPNCSCYVFDVSSLRAC